MKKNLLALFVLAFVFLSCEGPEGPPGESMNWHVADITVYSHEWEEEWDGDTPYYVCIKDYPIDNYIYDFGHVFAYYYIRYGEANEAQTLLPRYLEFLKFEPGQNVAWTESITYDYMPGSIAFYYQYSDFAEVQPPTEHFRIVMNW